MRSQAHHCPSFILPLPRDDGVEFFLLQWQLATIAVHFTPLAAFHRHGEDAPSCLDVEHYDELAESHALVLMRGQYDDKVLSKMQVRCLLHQLQLYYALDESCRALLARFNSEPDAFDYRELIERLGAVGSGSGE